MISNKANNFIATPKSRQVTDGVLRMLVLSLPMRWLVKLLPSPRRRKL
jgi:hypothetical protein